MPQVKIISTEANPFSITTNASNWGQLKDELSSRLPNLNSMTVVLSTTKATLDLDDAQLPTDQDYKVYASPKAIKQG